MSSEMTKFSDAVYHKKDKYEFAETIFTRRELNILLLVDGVKSVADISTSLSADIPTLMADFMKLIQLGLIQTESGTVSYGISDLIFHESPVVPSEYYITRLPMTAAA